MPKIKVRRVVEEEVDGAELIAQLRSNATLSETETRGFVIGDIVNLNSEKNREDRDSGTVPTCAIVTDTDESSQPLCCAYYDAEGELQEDDWFYAEGVELIEESPLRKKLTGAMMPDWAR